MNHLQSSSRRDAPTHDIGRTWSCQHQTGSPFLPWLDVLLPLAKPPEQLCTQSSSRKSRVACRCATLHWTGCLNRSSILIEVLCQVVAQALLASRGRYAQIFHLKRSNNMSAIQVQSNYLTPVHSKYSYSKGTQGLLFKKGISLPVESKDFCFTHFTAFLSAPVSACALTHFFFT